VFTGIIETVGSVVEVVPREGAARIGVAASLPAGALVDGESVAVDGTCLSVTRREGDRFWADSVQETLDRTTLGRLRPGDRVNLERSLRLGDRLSGHLVAGHVDATATVRAVRRAGDDHRLRVDLPASLARFVARKGSIALHGVSLTVAELGAGWLEVALVPLTLARTTLATLRPGDEVNVEVDLVARYLERMAHGPHPGEGEGRGAGDAT
jgi:riboflavin synthase